MKKNAYLEYKKKSYSYILNIVLLLKNFISSTLIKKNFKNNIILLFITISFFYLLYYYRKVGIHDAGVYINSGRAILHGKNPYLDPTVAARWGTFGPIIFAIIAGLIPSFLTATMFQALTLVSLKIFTKAMFPHLRTNRTNLMFLFLMWLSPVRELLAVNQMSGIIFGVTALGVITERKVKLNSSFSPFIVVAPFCFAIAIDVKPHLTILFIFGWCIYSKKMRTLFLSIFILLLGHISVDFSQGRILELDFMRQALQLSANASHNSLGDSVSFWPIIINYLNFPAFFTKVSFFLVLLLAFFSLYFAFKRNLKAFYFLSFFSSSFFIYFHLYDSFAICVLLIFFCFESKNIILASLGLSLSLIPLEFSSPKNILLILLFFCLFFLVKKFHIDSKFTSKFIIQRITFGFFLSFLLHIMNTLLNLSDHVLQSLITTEVLILTAALIWSSKDVRFSH